MFLTVSCAEINLLMELEFSRECRDESFFLRQVKNVREVILFIFVTERLIIFFFNIQSGIILPMTLKSKCNTSIENQTTLLKIRG